MYDMVTQIHFLKNVKLGQIPILSVRFCKTCKIRTKTIMFAYQLCWANSGGLTVSAEGRRKGHVNPGEEGRDDDKLATLV